MSEIISIVGSWLICAVAAERAAEAITTSVFFSPLRQFLAKVTLWELPVGTDYDPNTDILRAIKGISRWLSELVSCGWCTSFWTSLLCALTLPGRYTSLAAGDNILIKIVALWGFANLWHAVFRLIHNGRVAAVDLNVRLAGEAVDDNFLEIGDAHGDFGESGSKEDASGIEPPAV